MGLHADTHGVLVSLIAGVCGSKVIWEPSAGCKASSIVFSVLVVSSVGAEVSPQPNRDNINKIARIGKTRVTRLNSIPFVIGVFSGRPCKGIAPVTGGPRQT